MKLPLLSIVLGIFSLSVVVCIGSVFEYTTTYKNLSFDVRHALMESGKEAIIPKVSYEYRDCPLEDLEEDYCDEDGQMLIEIVEYMQSDEFFEILMQQLRNTKNGNDEVMVELMYYSNAPFLARVRVSTMVEGLFMNNKITIEEALIQN